RIAQDVLQRVGGRPHIEVNADESRAVFIVILLAVAGHVLTPDNALTVLPVARKGEAHNPVAFGSYRLGMAEEGENNVVDPLIICEVNDRTTATHDQQRIVVCQPASPC